MKKEKLFELNGTKLCAAKHWGTYFPFPTQGCVNTMILKRKENGVASSGALFVLHNKLYIKVKEFQEYLNKKYTLKTDEDSRLTPGGKNGGRPKKILKEINETPFL